MSTVYYAVKWKASNAYWQRNGSSTPALFTTENRAKATIKQYTRRTEDEYTIVKFMEIE